MSIHPHTKIIVVGGGACGITTAITLLEAGYKHVWIVSATLSPYTTTDQSGALWRPIFVAEDAKHKIHHWGKITFDRYLQDAKQYGQEMTSVTIVPGYDLYRNKQTPEIPFWHDIVHNFKVLSADQVKQHSWNGAAIQHAHYYESVIAHPTIYLRFLWQKFLQLGGQHAYEHIDSFTQLQDKAHVIINCTGLGAKQLLQDQSIYPCRGQTVKVKNPGVDHFYICCDDDDFLAYIFPRPHDLLLGGTHQDHDHNTKVSEQDTKDIVARCAKIIPAVADAPIVNVSCGLRPVRDSIRLELDRTLCTVPVIHNYGHGGAGMTLHWGCAQDVLSLVLQAQPPSAKL